MANIFTALQNQKRIKTEMAYTIGFIDKYEVIVNDRDSDHEPHLHIQLYDNDKNVVFETRISLIEADYYDDKDLRLPNKQIVDAFDNFMRSNYSSDDLEGVIIATNWAYCVNQWNHSKDNMPKIIKGTKIPNYRNLKFAK